jgi:Putative abortive phage resistance protein AbiGi, antitoxin
MATIEELLHRRTDLSTFLVHFTRETDTAPRSARDKLVNILHTRRLQARAAYGMATELAARYPQVAVTQQVVCFTETPLEHAWMMVSPIEGRSVQFDGHGVAFTKTFARRKGVNPVWYLDMTPSGHDWLTEPVRGLVEQAVADAARQATGGPDPEELAAAPILRLTPFVEQMGTPGVVRKEFWWEREWRHVGDLQFAPADIVVAFAPQAEHDWLRERLAQSPHYPDGALPLVDASWGLERMIGALAGVAGDNLGPFPT